MRCTVGVYVLAAVIFGHSLDAQSRPQGNAGTLAQFSASIEDLARAASPAVVQITVRGRARRAACNGPVSLPTSRSQAPA